MFGALIYLIHVASLHRDIMLIVTPIHVHVFKNLFGVDIGRSPDVFTTVTH